MAALASDIQITTSLIDDYLLTVDAPVGPNPAGRFVAVQDPSSTAPLAQLLAVDSSGQTLMHFHADPTSHSGWATTSAQVQVPAACTPQAQIARLAAFAQSGTINALAYFPLPSGTGNAATWMRCPSSGVWGQAQLSHDSANALGFTYQTDTYIDAAGNQYLYGVTGNVGGGAFFLVSFDSQSGAWEMIYEQPLTGFTPAVSAGAAFRLMPGPNGGINVLWIDQGIVYWQSADVDNLAFWTGTPASFNPGIANLTIAEIVPLPGSAGQNNLLIVDGAGTLRIVQGYDQPNPAMTALTGGDGQPAGAVSATASVDGSGNLMVLLSETATQALWILRQAGSDGVVPSFDPWVPLGNTVAAVAAPPVMAAGPELFLVDVSLDAYHMAQTVTDQVWATRQIAAPATQTDATPARIAATTMNLTVVDQNQMPIGGALISVASDQPAMILVNGISFPIAPNAPAQIQADPTGQANVIVETVTLSPPPLTFTVTNPDGSTAQRACQGDQVQVLAGETPVPPCPASIASRLAGQDPNQPLTATALQTAGLISAYPDASGVVSAITAAGQWMLTSGAAPVNSLTLDQVTVPNWRIDFPATGSPVFTPLSDADVDAHLAGRPTAALGSSLSAIFGDVANFFKHAWDKLASIVIKVGKTIEEGLTIVFNDVQTFVITTVRQAGQALETIFSRIVQGVTDAYDKIKNVIDWLKQLFEWGDILNTHKVISTMITSALNELVACIGIAETTVEEKFATAKAKITDVFGNLESAFAAGQSFHAFANAAGASPIGGSGNVLDGQPATTAYKQNGPRATYVHNHAKAYYTGSNINGGGGGSTGTVQSLVQSNWTGQDADTSRQTMQDFLTSTVTSPKDFFDLIIVGFLEGIQDMLIFVLDAVEDIVEAALEVLKAAIEGLQTIWTGTVNIPIISWLYKNVITGTPAQPGDDLTVLDVLSLALAVPGTILYKILVGHGSAPFTTAQAENIVANGLQWPDFSNWPPQASGALTAAPSLAAVAQPGTLPLLMGVIAGVSNFFGAFVTAGADGIAFSESPDVGLKTFLSWGSVILSVVTQVGSAPWGVFTNGVQSSADGWTVALWAFGWVPVASDSIFTFATGGLARYTDELGPVLDMGMGLALTGLAVAVVVEQAGDKADYTGWDQANALVPQIGRILKVLILTKDQPEEAVTMPILLVADVALGIGATVTQIGNAIDG